jgi:type IV secretion system protein VirB6
MDAASRGGGGLMAFCPALPNAGMVASIVDTVDCHIRALVHDSYRDLVGPNTWFATAFTGLLTIYIALLGYQLLFGRGGLRVTELPFTVLKIGLILAFLTSWAAYQTLIFDLLFDGPAEIMKVLLGPLAAQGAGFNGDVMAGVQNAFEDLSGAAGVYGGMASPSANLLQGGPMLGSGLLWLSAIALLLVTLGLIIAAKIVLAFLLAVGPVFIGMLLFDQTRGLFEGWVRATLSFAMAPLAVNVFGAVMLMILAPFLEVLVGNAGRQFFDMGPVITVALIIAVFAVVMAFGLGAVGAIARGFGMSRRVEEGPAQRRLAAPDRPLSGAPGERAEQIAARIALIDRNQAVEAGAYSSREVFTRRSGEIADAVASTPLLSSDRLGQAYSRAPRPTARRGETG